LAFPFCALRLAQYWRGKCALCLETTDLQDSHFLPKAFYKLARTAGETNPNPIVVNPNVAMKTSKQVSDFLLCAACEDRFNKSGESWMTSNCWRSDADFPLYFAIKAAKPAWASNDFSVYKGAEISGVDVRKLTYFAMSVFWRGGVHEFGPIAGHKPTKLELGPYAEELRQFLLGTAGFPSHVALAVTVSSTPETGRNEMMIFPWRKDHRPDMRQFSFVIPGVTFQMFTGKGMSKAIRDWCIVRSPANYIYMAPRMEEANLTNMAHLLAKSRPVGDLR